MGTVLTKSRGAASGLNRTLTVATPPAGMTPPVVSSENTCFALPHAGARFETSARHVRSASATRLRRRRRAV